MTLKNTKGEHIHGIIGAKPPHLLSAEESKKPVNENELYIDVGLNSAEEVAEYGIRIGTTGVLHDPFVEMPNNIIRGRAIDDRLGCNILIHLLKRLKDEQLEETLLFQFSVQEEVGARGAGVGAFTLEPTMAIAVETTTGDKNPHIKEREAPAEFLKGPHITIMDSSTITSQKVNERIIKNAELDNIRFEFKKPRIGGGTNAGKIHLTRGGVPSSVISVPCKYLHSPVTYASMQDALEVLNLLESFVKNKAKVTV